MKGRGMDCDAIRATLAGGELSAGVEDHLLACEACAALVVRHLAEREIPAPTEIDALLASVELEIESDRGVLVWARSLSTDVRWLIVMGAASLCLLVTAGLARRSDLADIGAASAAVAGLYALLLGAIVAQGVRPMHRRELDGMRRRMGWAAVFVPVAVALLGPMVSASAHGTAQQDCFPLGLLVATCLVGLLRALDRSAHRGDGAALLAVGAGGIVANLALLLHCSDMRMAHVLPAHATVGLVLAFIYFGPGRRWQASALPRRR
jgi:hypothetical protein